MIFIHIGLILLSVTPIILTLLLAYQTMRAGFSFVGKTPLKSKFVFYLNKIIAGLIMISITIVAISPSFFLYFPFIIQNEIAEVQKLMALIFLFAGNVLLASGYWTLSIFTRVGLPIGKHVLCTNGVFRISRNPIYTAMIFLFSSCFFLIPSVYIALGVGYVLLTNHIIILSEEKYLELTFGSEYIKYKHTAARYL